MGKLNSLAQANTKHFYAQIKTLINFSRRMNGVESARTILQ